MGCYIDNWGNLQASMTHDEVVSAVNRWRQLSETKKLFEKIAADRKAFVDGIMSGMQEHKK